MFKSKPNKSDALIKNKRRSTLRKNIIRKNVEKVILLLIKLLMNFLNSAISQLNFNITQQFLLLNSKLTLVEQNKTILFIT